jgi:PAS domain S-box-containing protein
MTPLLTQLLFDESPDALIGLSTDGTVVFWNRGAQGIFGYSAEEAVGKSIYALVITEDRIEEENQLLQRAHEKGISAYESIRQSSGAKRID